MPTCRCGGTGRRKGLKIPRWQHCTGSIPVNGTILYRGVEQLVARRAHNPEVVWFKSHPRNQKEKPSSRMVFLFGTMCSLRERDAHYVRDASFGREVRLWRVSWNTSHHCERKRATSLCRKAQHHGGKAAASLNESLPQAFSCYFSRRNSKDIISQKRPLGRS